jgi:hypothetical protein
VVARLLRLLMRARRQRQAAQERAGSAAHSIATRSQTTNAKRKRIHVRIRK